MVWAVYHTIPLPPSEEGEEEGATSCGLEPKGMGNSLSVSPLDGDGDGDGDATILEFLNIVPWLSEELETVKGHLIRIVGSI
jgi:hypothetical protein